MKMSHRNGFGHAKIAGIGNKKQAGNAKVE